MLYCTCTVLYTYWQIYSLKLFFFILQGSTLIVILALSSTQASFADHDIGSNFHASYEDQHIHHGPTTIEKTEPYHVEVVKKIGVPQPHPVGVPVPQVVKIGVPQPYAVQVAVPQPVAVPIYKLVPQEIEKKVPIKVEKLVPVYIKKPYQVTLEKHYPVYIDKPYPVHVPVYKHVYVGGPKKSYSGFVKHDEHH